MLLVITLSLSWIFLQSATIFQIVLQKIKHHKNAQNYVKGIYDLIPSLYFIQIPYKLSLWRLKAALTDFLFSVFYY